MARYTGPRCRICRRNGTKLFLKGQKCFGAKCILERRNSPPGQHGIGKRRKKTSNYGIQLREKQKLRNYYGMLEKQLKIFFKRAVKKKGITGDNLLRMLELRLDNIVYRLGFASTKSMARQWVCHGHFLVNGKRVDIPSYIVKEKDIIEVVAKDKVRARIKETLEITESWEVPDWLSIDRKAMKGAILKEPEKDDITVPANEQFVVELYSR